MPANFTPTQEPEAHLKPKANETDPDEIDFLLFRGNITGTELGTTNVFAEFRLNNDTLNTFSDDAATRTGEMRSWLKQQVDARYFTEVQQRQITAPPAPEPERIPLSELREIFGTPKGQPLMLTIEETYVDKGEEPPTPEEKAGKERKFNILGQRRDKGGENKGGKRSEQPGGQGESTEVKP